MRIVFLLHSFVRVGVFLHQFLILIDMLANVKKNLEQNWKIEKLSHIVMDFKSGFFAVFAGGGWILFFGN